MNEFYCTFDRLLWQSMSECIGNNFLRTMYSSWVYRQVHLCTVISLLSIRMEDPSRNLQCNLVAFLLSQKEQKAYFLITTVFQSLSNCIYQMDIITPTLKRNVDWGQFSSLHKVTHLVNGTIRDSNSCRLTPDSDFELLCFWIGN